jgi:hypothetical protein
MGNKPTLPAPCSDGKQTHPARPVQRWERCESDHSGLARGDRNKRALNDGQTLRGEHVAPGTGYNAGEGKLISHPNSLPVPIRSFRTPRATRCSHRTGVGTFTRRFL